MTVRRGLGLFAPLLWGLAGCERPVDLPADLGWGEAPVVAYADQPRLAITNNGDDTLSFLSPDPAAPRVLGVAPIGQNPLEPSGPHHLVASPDGRYLYFNLSNYVTSGGSGPHGAHGTGQVPGSVVKLDTRTNRFVAQLLVDRSPGDIILTRDGSRLYVSHYDLLRFASHDPSHPETGYSQVAVIDAAAMRLLSMIPVCPTAHGMGLDQSEQLLYVTCSLSDELAVIDVADASAPKVLQRAPLVSGQLPEQPAVAQPYALTVHPKDGSVWVSDNLSYDVRVFSAESLARGATATGPQRVIRLGGVAMFADFSADAATLYVPLQKANQVPDQLVAIDTASGTVSQSVDMDSSCQAPHVVKRIDNTLVLVCEGDHLKKPGAAVYLSAAPLKALAMLPLGLFSDGVVLVKP